VTVRPRSAGRGGALARFLDTLLKERLYSAAVALVARGRRVIFCRAAAAPGAGAREAARRVHWRFDLASLTKPFQATLGLALARSGELPLETTLGELFDGAAHVLRATTLEELLRHRAGLRPWVPLYALCRDRLEARDRILAGEWAGAATGTYSDLGYILWSFAVERALGEPLEQALRRRVLLPLGLQSVSYRPGPAGSGPGVVPCGIDGAKEVQLAHDLGLEIELLPAPGVGEVQDGNARFLGVAGHAGLFGTVADLATLIDAWRNPQGPLTPEAVRAALAGKSRYRLGWERRRVKSSAGPALSTDAFGHTGFTGGSVWHDPRIDGTFVLLGHRRSALSRLDGARRRFHRLATAELRSEARTRE
jgi:CubicO group peptidase (beta-lactamase class C family)